LFTTFWITGAVYMFDFALRGLNLYDGIDEEERAQKTDSGFLLGIYWFFYLINFLAITSILVLPVASLYLWLTGKRSGKNASKHESPQITDDHDEEDEQFEEYDFPKLREARKSITRMDRIRNLKVIRYSELLAV
jgi:hypothetical protein